MAEQDQSAPNAPTFRLNTGETVSKEELIRRVSERVYQMWLEEMQLARMRGSDSARRFGRSQRK